VIEASDFINPALKRGYRSWTGVPCSFLKPFINFVIESPSLDYVAASSEGEAIAISMGAHLAGKKTITICQNSGLGNTVNPLTSLNFPFKIPTLLIVTHRGAPGLADEPQHELMGHITEQLLDVMKIPWKVFPQTSDKIDPVLDEAETYFNKGQTFALIMKKGTVAPCHLKGDMKVLPGPKKVPAGQFTLTTNQKMKRMDAIHTVLKTLKGTELLIGTTGKTGRELYALGHNPNQLYVVGGMGCASGIALGLSLNTKRKVIVFDGDGAALMKMGTMATIGHYNPKNLIHILIDNEAHESTGGQLTISGSIDFGQIASACGYNRIIRCEHEEGLREAMETVCSQSGPSFIHIKIKSGSDPNLGRPALTPVQVKDQFMEFAKHQDEPNCFKSS